MRFGGKRGGGGPHDRHNRDGEVLMFTPSVLLLFNVNDAGPNVNGVILQVGVFVSVNVLNTLTLLVD